MNDVDPLLFPDRISDEAAAVLCDFLYDLAAACESRYLEKLRRHRRVLQLDLFDPQQPRRTSSGGHYAD